MPLAINNGLIIQYSHGFSNNLAYYPLTFTSYNISVLACPHEEMDNDSPIATKQMQNWSNKAAVYFRCSYYSIANNMDIAASWIIDIIAIGY